MPPSRVWTTWVCRDGTTRPLPRLTSSSTAKCAQTRNAARRARKVNSSMREVRGVRSAAAARMSLANAKSDGGIGFLNHGYCLGKIRLSRVLGGRRDRFALQDGQDFIARAIGDQAAVIEQQQPIDHAEKRKAVGGDDDCHPVATNSLQPFQKLAFATDIKMRGRLVQKQYPGLSDQHAGKPNGLFLAAGQTATALRNGHIVSHRVAGDEAFHARKTRRRENLLVGRFGLAQRNVIAKFSKEQVSVLHRKSDAGAQIRRIVLARVDAIDQDSSFLSFIETEQEAPDRRFSGAYASDDADPLATFDLEGNLFQRFAG